MDVKFEKQDRTLTVFLRGEIDHHAAGGLREQIDGAVVSGGIVCLVLDFSEVSFMDSSGVGLILGRYTMCPRRQTHGARYDSAVSRNDENGGNGKIRDFTNRGECDQ